jgi:senataxin
LWCIHENLSSVGGGTCFVPSSNFDELMDIEALLKRLRDEPAHNEDASEDVLASVYGYLMAATPVDGSHHWFCGKAEPLRKEAASFLLRLFAYTSGKVIKWKDRVEQILSSCVGCVKGFAEVKSTSRRT